MLVLPAFQVLTPRTLPEALDALAGPPGEALPVAGGTDLLPNLKHGLFTPKRLVALRGLSMLREVRETEDGSLVLGAGISLARLAALGPVRERYPALAQAAAQVAGPQLREMGTLGGNLCLDTRCVYYNQTQFWRKALGYCLKKDGTVCHVVPGGTRCVAAYSADTPGPLLAYGARVTLASTRGVREVPVAEFFRGDGIRNTTREPDEILTEVTLPAPAPGARSAFVKLRMRQAIDFPVLSVSAACTLDARDHVETLTLVVGAVASQPRVIRGAGERARGRRLDAGLIEELGRLAHAQCPFLPSINVDSAWRREVLPVFVRRAFATV